MDNLRVPKNASCELNGTRVKGTIKVENGATLKAVKVTVIGNIQAEGARLVVVKNSRVGGSIQIKQGGAARIRNVSVTGDSSAKRTGRDRPAGATWSMATKRTSVHAYRPPVQLAGCGRSSVQGSERSNGPWDLVVPGSQAGLGVFSSAISEEGIASYLA